MFGRKAQLSFEYMTIVAFVAIITIPLILIYYNYSNTTADEINMNQLLQVSRKIADTADSVYYLGKPAEVTLKVYMPKNVNSVSIGSNEVAFEIQTMAGSSDILSSTNVNVSGTVPITQGIHYIDIKAEDYHVEISGT